MQKLDMQLVPNAYKISWHCTKCDFLSNLILWSVEPQIIFSSQSTRRLKSDYANSENLFCTGGWALDFSSFFQSSIRLTVFYMKPDCSAKKYTICHDQFVRSKTINLNQLLPFIINILINEKIKQIFAKLPNRERVGLEYVTLKIIVRKKEVFVSSKSSKFSSNMRFFLFSLTEN